jgi:hypothetical protein
LHGSYFLTATGPHRTVFDDGSGNVLCDGTGADWVFANLDGAIPDQLAGNSPNRVIGPLS